ncbi:MAG: hypothetical protein ACLU38_09650 [Dysosmobacter sp.]
MAARLTPAANTVHTSVNQADDGGYGDGNGLVEYHPVQQHQLGEVGAGQNGAARGAT